MPFELVAATSPVEATAVPAEERRWQPHSSTDVYTNAAASGDGYVDPVSMDSAYGQTVIGHSREGSPSSPNGTRSGTQAAWSPTRSPLRPAVSSARSLSSSSVRPPSPSYFANVAVSSGRQPTITFTGAPTEAGILAPTSPGVLDAQSSPMSAQSVIGHGGHGSATTSALPSSPRSVSSPGDGGHAIAPVSPGGSARSKPGSSQIGFFAALRPSSPKVVSQPREDGAMDRRRDKTDREGGRDKDRSSLGTLAGPEPEMRPRRPSSVFEQVGIVWERFGRKVHHVRNSTSDSAPGSSKRGSAMLSASSPASESVEEKSPSTASSVSGLQVSPQQAAPSGGIERRGSTSSTLEQRLPAWLEESLAEAAIAESTAPGATLQPHCERESRSPGPNLSTHALGRRAAAPSSANATSSNGGPAGSAGSSTTSQVSTSSPDPSMGAGHHARREMFRQPSAGSVSIDESFSPSSLHDRSSSLLDRVLIQVTEDNERFSVVDVSAVDSAAAIKERMFAKLHLFDEDYSNFQLFRTEIGQTNATGPVVNDDALLALCLQMGDDRGTLKFLVQQTSPPSRPAGRAMPPPLMASSPRRAMRELSSTSDNNAEHRRAGSQSSKSSISDAFVTSEILQSEGAGEHSHRHSGSGLQRSRAQARRALPDAPGAGDDLRSPVHGNRASGGGFDRRSTASSADDPERARPDGVYRRVEASEATSSNIKTSQDEGFGRFRSFSPPVQSPHSSKLQEQQQHHATQPLRTAHRDDSHHSAQHASHPQQQQRGPTHPPDAVRCGSGDRETPRSLQAGNRAGLGPGSHKFPGSELGQNGHARLRSEGEDGGSGARGAAQLTIHNAKSMDDLRKRPAPPPPPMPLNMNMAMLSSIERDGRYPNPAIARPSSAKPAVVESTHVQRQLSSDAHMGRFGPPGAQPDPRALQRNRSAQAALAVSVPGASGSANGPRMPSIPGPARSPAMLGRDAMTGPPHDARFGNRPVVMDDARFAPNRMPQNFQHPQLSRPGSAHPAGSASPGYGFPVHHQHAFPQSQHPHPHAHDPHRGHPMMSQAHPGEFGVRAHGPHLGPQDPRAMSMGQNPYSARPHTLHDASFNPNHYRAPMATSPPYRSREDPFTSLYFPASSSRQVSEFQMAAGRLEPGMTVQETMQHRSPSANQAAQPQHGAWDMRRPSTSAEPQMHSSRRGQAATMSPRREQPTMLPPPADWKAGAPPYLQHQQHNQVQQYQQHQQHPIHPMHHMHQQSGPSGHQISHQRPPARPSQFHESPSSGGYAEHVARESGGRPNASERSSGSSFGSSDAHRGAFAGEERQGRGSIETSFSAPTSARSSQGSVLNFDLRKDRQVEDSRPSDNRTQEGDLQDEELMHVRPLPRPPQASQTTLGDENAAVGCASGDGKGTPKPHEGEGTLKANNVASLWNALSANRSDDLSDTFASNSDSGTLRAPSTRSMDGSEALSTGSGTTVTAHEQHGSDVDAKAGGRMPSIEATMDEDEGGTLASFASFDDDESEAGTWAQPLDSDPSAPRLPLIVDSGGSVSDVEGEHTLQPGQGPLVPALETLSSSSATNGQVTSSPRRPELRLTIETPTASQQASPRISPHPSSARLSSAGQTHTSGGGGVQRSYSFAKRDNDWAFRPPPEQLYENLDDFFPKHDLDKPLLETVGIPESPGLTSPKADAIPAQLVPPTSAGSNVAPLSRHKKSIRIVAQDRKKYLDRAEKRVSVSPGASNNALARRRSTRLWGTKVIEMTPGQDASTPASVAPAESPSGDGARKPVFKWVKGDLIGKGTYGRVYLALNATTGEMIAVKQVELPRTASDREDTRQKGVVAALKSEIETLKDLDHPHIVAYLGFEETTSFLSIFLEYVPGGSVGSCLRKHGKFEEPTIKSFLHQILEGLAYLHSRGILHRDLKADNILVDFEGICKISDFGTVRRSDDIYGNVEDMSLQGSIFWMAPEVVSLSKKGYSAKVDIWSLGCVVLEMFAGRRPWSDDEAVQAMFKIGAERRAPPIPPDVTLSKKAAHFLKNCFEIDPAKRPTAARLLDHVFSVPEEGWHFQHSSLWRHLKK